MPVTTRSQARRSRSARKIQRWVRRKKSATSQSRQISKAFKSIRKIRTDMRADDQKYGLFKEFISSI